MQLDSQMSAKPKRKYVPPKDPGVVARSRITNGRELLPGVDGRSEWARRFRDLIQLLQSDLGGESECSEAEKLIVRRAACLTTECEHFEALFATLRDSGQQPRPDDVDLYQRMSSAARRMLESTGLKRRAKDITPPSVAQYLREAEDAQEA
jgi:hypothetical protein